MLNQGIIGGSKDVSIYIVLRNTSNNQETTAKTHSDVTGSYCRQGAARTAITMATLAAVTTAHTDGGFIEIDATNQPGLYRFDIPDAAFAVGVQMVTITAKVTASYVYHERFDILADKIAATVNTANTTATKTLVATAGLTSTQANNYRGASVRFTSGALLNQRAIVVGSEWDGVNSEANLTLAPPLSDTPANSVSFVLER